MGPRSTTFPALAATMSVRCAVLGLLISCGSETSAPAPVEKSVPTPAPAPAPAETSASAPKGDALVAESFDSAAALDGWQRMAGAQLAASPENEVGWDDGAVRMRASRDTRMWTALYREIDIGEARWLTVSAKIRTDGIDPAGSQLQNCNLFLKHAGGIVGTRVVSGTQLTTVRRRFEVTPGKVTLGFFSSLPGQVWFDDIRLEKSAAPAWSEKTHGHYRYRTLPGDTVDEKAIAYNEESFRIVSAYLGVSGPSPVVFMKYPDLATIEELTGFAGNAFRDGPTMHSIWARDRHEIVHVLADAWGDPPALLAEGLAVFLSGAWQGKPVRAYARELVASSRWHPPTSLLASQRFRGVPDLESYAVGGAFVQWLESTQSRAALRDLYRKLVNKASEADNRKHLEAALGPSADVDAKVRAWVLSQ